MFRYWFKNRLLFDLVISVVLSLLFCFAFVFLSSSNYSNTIKENNIYLNSKIDYQIPNPSINQLAEIKNEPFVDETFGYYLTKTTVKANNTAKINLLMSDTMESLSITMFNANTLLNSKENVSNYAYLDKTASDALNANVGDILTISLAGKSFKHEVTAVFEKNAIYNEGTIIVEFAGAIKNVYESNVSSNSYSAAFIDASNDADCENYLNHYIPLGRLKDRSEFDSDDAYNLYNDTILSGNYSKEITNFSEYRNTAQQEVKDAKNKFILMSFVGSIVVGIAYLLVNLVLRSRKSENQFFGYVLKNKKSIAIYRWLSFILSTMIYLVISIGVSAAFGNVIIVILSSLITVFVFVLTQILNLVQDKKYIKIKGSKNECEQAF